MTSLLFAEALPFVFFGVIFAVIIYFAYLSHKKEKARKAAVLQWATSQGYQVLDGKDHASAERFKYFDLMRAGANQYFELQVRGEHHGLPFVLFDYHYETYSHDKNGRKTHHHYFSACIIETGLRFPSELRLRPEHFFDKIKGAVGFNDIDFESDEFSKRFHVASKDRKFAYDFIHQKMMEYLLQWPQTSFEIEHNAIMLYFGQKKQTPEIYQAMLDHARHILELSPDYLIQELKAEG